MLYSEDELHSNISLSKELLSFVDFFYVQGNLIDGIVDKGWNPAVHG